MPLIPDIAVIVVNYNTAGLTGRCLESLRQYGAGTLHEVILVDNASTDDSVAVITSRFPEVRLITNQQNVGFGPANNQAAEIATGKYLFFLNSDTELVEDSLAVLRDFLDRHPRAGAVGCRLVSPDGLVQPSAAYFPNLLRIVAGREVAAGAVRRHWPELAERLTFFISPEDLQAPCQVDWCVGAALAVRREAFEAVGGFDPRIFLYAEEMDLCLSMARAGWEVHFTPKTTIIHAEAASSGRALHPMRLARIAAGHRYVYYKHHGWKGRIYCLAEIGASLGKAGFWWTLGFPTTGSRRRKYMDKALWHWLYLKHYALIHY